MNVMVACRMKGAQIVITLNRTVWAIQRSPHTSRSSIMIYFNFLVTSMKLLIINSVGEQMTIIIITVIIIINGVLSGTSKDVNDLRK